VDESGNQGSETPIYSHLTVNHSENFRDPATGAHTNTIEGTWAGLKRAIKPRNRSKDNPEEHLMEFIWRRKHENNLWDAFINAIGEIHWE
jgi:hypothetical protein